MFPMIIQAYKLIEVCKYKLTDLLYLLYESKLSQVDDVCNYRLQRTGQRQSVTD